MIKHTFKRALGRGVLVCPLALVAACGAEAPTGDFEQRPDDVEAAPGAERKPSGAEPTSASNAIGTIETKDGAIVTIEAGKEGPISVSVTGAEAAVSAASERLDLTGSVLEVYSILAPETEIPEAVFSAADRIAEEGALAALEAETQRHIADLEGTELGGAELEVVALDPATVEQMEAELAGAATDALALVQKEAPRDSAGFRTNFCGKDQINEAAAQRSYARKVQTCQTEKTGNHTQTMTAVVQGVAGARSYRGSINLVWYWKNGSTWTKGGTDVIAENTSALRWVFGNPTNELRFAIESASGDGWHMFAHKADPSFSEQKALTGTDYYHQVCDCTDGSTTVRTVIEGCQNNQSVHNNNVTGLCQAYALFDDTAEDLGITSCVPVNTGAHERVSWGRNCSNAAGQNYNDCELLNECIFECTDICR